MKGARRLSDYLKEELKRKEFKQSFDDEEVFAYLAIQIAQLRQKNGFSQKELARVLRTTQQTVSRLEDHRNKSISLNTLIKLAAAFHRKLKIQFA